MAILATAIGVGAKLFKGLRQRRKQKRLDRKLKKSKRKEEEARKELSNLIPGGAGLNQFSPSLDFAQELTFPEAGINFGGSAGKIFKSARGLNPAGSPSNGEDIDQGGYAPALGGSGGMMWFNKLPIWAKILGGIVIVFAGWKLFFSKKRRR